AAGANALSQRPLRHEFELDLAGKVPVGKGARIGRAREGADHLPDHASVDHGSNADAPVAGIVVDDRKVLGSAINQRVNELNRRARAAEATDHDGCAVIDGGNGSGRAFYRLVHVETPDQHKLPSYG